MRNTAETPGNPHVASSQGMEQSTLSELLMEAHSWLESSAVAESWSHRLNPETGRQGVPGDFPLPAVFSVFRDFSGEVSSPDGYEVYQVIEAEVLNSAF